MNLPSIKLMSIVGARPNFMKIAPLAHEIARCQEFEHLLIHTGQHYDQNLSDVFFEELGIPRPDLNLGVGSGSREDQIEQIMASFDPVVQAHQPDAVIVVGDVNSTIACARVAVKYGVKVVHVEAGLRSFDRAMPEETNRVETDEISDYLFVTEPSGMQNLRREANRGQAFLVGNVMIDTLVANLDQAKAHGTAAVRGLTRGEYAVATFHRPSNVDDRDNLLGIIETIKGICERIQLVLPLHPRTRHSLESHQLMGRLRDTPGLRLVDPLGYLQFIGLVEGARVVVTDSGGIQEETTYLQVPCLTMRENTERPITVDVGSNQLVGSDRAALLGALDQVLAGKTTRGQIPELWDGHAAARIVEQLRALLAKPVD